MAVAVPVVTSVDHRTRCTHCGDECGATSAIVSARGSFCCRGCESVFSILSSFGLDRFYALDDAPGVSQKATATLDAGRFASLDDPDVAARLITFDDGRLARATLSIPTIHCASCVWLLEQLWRFEPGVVRAEVDLLRRAVHVEFRSDATSLRRIAETIASLGYEPAITTETAGSRAPPAIAGSTCSSASPASPSATSCCSASRATPTARPLERRLPAAVRRPERRSSHSRCCSSARPTTSASPGRRSRTRAMALEVPVALGLAVLFGRSLVDIASGRGEGFMDSFAGLVFFLLIGRLFQHKAFERIAFDRTFRSFLPLSVQIERDGSRRRRRSSSFAPATASCVRPHEVVPADAALLDERAGHRLRVHHRRADARRGRARRDGPRRRTRCRPGMRLRVQRDVSHSQLARAVE